MPRSTIAAPLFGFDLPVYAEGMGGFTLGLAGVNGMLNQAPQIVLSAGLGALLMGPAVGAVFHGILQDTVARVAPPAVAIGGTAITTALVAGHRSVGSPPFLVAVGFVLCVAYAYRETGNLRLVMAAYGLFNALAVLLAWGDILASLYAAGHLVG